LSALHLSPPADEVQLQTQYLLDPAFMHKQLQRKKQHQKQQLIQRAQQQQLDQLNGAPSAGGAGVGSGVRGGEGANGEGDWWHSTGRRRDRMGSFYGAQGLESQRQDRYRAAHHSGKSEQWKTAVHSNRRNSTATAAALAAPAAPMAAAVRGSSGGQKKQPNSASERSRSGATRSPSSARKATKKSSQSASKVGSRRATTPGSNVGVSPGSKSMTMTHERSLSTYRRKQNAADADRARIRQNMVSTADYTTVRLIIHSSSNILAIQTHPHTHTTTTTTTTPASSCGCFRRQAQLEAQRTRWRTRQLDRSIDEHAAAAEAYAERTNNAEQTGQAPEDIPAHLLADPRVSGARLRESTYMHGYQQNLVDANRFF
jgi:hypothetical protein